MYTSIHVTGIEEDGPQLSSQGIRFCTEMIQDMVLSRLSSHVAGKLLSSVNVLRESFTGEGSSLLTAYMCSSGV